MSEQPCGMVQVCPERGDYPCLRGPAVVRDEHGVLRCAACCKDADGEGFTYTPLPVDLNAVAAACASARWPHLHESPVAPATVLAIVAELRHVRTERDQLVTVTPEEVRELLCSPHLLSQAERVRRMILYQADLRKKAEAERDELLTRCREAAQTLIACVGAAGPMDVGEAATQAVAEIEQVSEIAQDWNERHNDVKRERDKLAVQLARAEQIESTVVDFLEQYGAVLPRYIAAIRAAIAVPKP